MKAPKTPSTIEEIQLTLLQKRYIYLSDDVNRDSIVSTLIMLDYLAKLSKKPITLYIDSPGGSVDSGLALYDYMKTSRAPIHTVCRGLAASMGAILLAGGEKGHRAAHKHSRIMIHQPSGGFIGKSSDMENYASEIVKMRQKINQLLANDTGQTLKKVSIDTEKDFFMTSEEALKYGIIDRIL